MSQLSDFLSNYSGVSSGMPIAYSNLTAGEAVQQGDIIVQGADGKAYWGNDPGLNADFIHPLINLVPKYNVQAAPASVLVSALWTASAPLSNGNYAVGMLPGDGSVIVQIMKTDGTQVGATVTVAANGSVANLNYPTSNLNLIGLSGGGFALTYATAAGVNLAIYDNTGAVIKAPAQILAGVNVSALCQISSGNIVVAGGSVTTAANPVFSIVTAAGAAVSGPTGSGISATNTYSIAVAPCGTGFILAAGVNNSGTSDSYWSSFQANGTAINTGAALTSSAAAVVEYCVMAVGTPGGGAFVGTGSHNTNASSLQAFTAAGAASGGRLDNATQTSVYAWALIPIGSGCLVFSVGASGVFGGLLSSTTTWSVGPAQLSTTAGVARGTIAAAPLSDGNYAVACTGAQMGRANSGGAAVGTMTAFSGGYGMGLMPTTVANLASGATPYGAVNAPYWFAFTGGTEILFAGNMQTCVPVGVAAGAAAAGASVKIQVLGPASTRLTFKKPYATNGGSPSVGYGQRMSVIGNLALLNGIQSASPRAIN